MHSETPLILEKWNFILLLGESGGGKGTLVKNIREYWLPDLVSASMGDIFREKAKTDPEIKRLTDEGILIDDHLVFQMFKEFALSSTPGLMDGFPRNRAQTLDLIKFIKEKGWRVLVINIHCRIETIIERLLARGREDDKLAIMYKRNNTHKTLHPAVMEEINHRPDLFDVIHLDGNLGAEIVFSNFLLDVLRLVDMLYFYDIANLDTLFQATTNETTINPAINRWISGLLKSVQERIIQKEFSQE